jgi:hypothetical protein
MRITAFSTLAVGLGLVGSHLVACSDTADDCNATATCGTSGGTTSGSAGKPGAGDGNEGGSDGAGSSSGGSQGTSGTSGTTGAGGQGGAGSTMCTGDVADDPLCWTTNELGVFVSSDIGDDVAGDGTREAPYATITKGIASAAGKNVYVCLGAADAYAEKITITAATDGVRLYGGFECDNWSHDVTRYVTVESPEPIALRIQSLNEGARIENVRFFASDGTAADKSSFGAFVTDSSGVVLRRVEITAGDGADGEPGGPGSKGADGAAAAAGQDGEPSACGGTPTDGVPGKWDAPVCGSKGGNGGQGVLDDNGANGFNGTPSSNVTPPNSVNRGVGATTAAAGDNGGPGASGNHGPLAEQSAALGTFAATGYSPASGKAGTDGFPGQGGGGGGGSKGSATCRGASGGAGGMGGCGGTAGGPGLGGGASVGLFSWNSEVSLDACVIASGSGGSGGAGGKGGGGGAGAEGGSGGKGDVGNGIAVAGRGGLGGSGGNGGSGSGGTGGPSYAIAFSGTKPSYTLPDTTLTEGTGGDPGIGGQVLDAKAPDGSVGDSAPEFEIQ